jgi:hypothetical protein
MVHIKHIMDKLGAKPVVKLGTPLYPYESGTWGPKELESVAPPGGWQNPVIVGA